MKDALVTALTFAPLAIVIYAVWRNRRADRAFQAEMISKHDAVCAGGAWPHGGACMPKGDPNSDRELISWLILSRTTAVGYGTLPLAVLARMDRALQLFAPVKDEECNGAG